MIRKLFILIISVLAIISFFNCGFSDNSVDFHYKKVYEYNYSLDTLKTKIFYLKNINNDFQKLGENYRLDTTRKIQTNIATKSSTIIGQDIINKVINDTIELFMKNSSGFLFYPKIVLSGNSKKSSLELLYIRYEFSGEFSSAGDKEKLDLLNIFEKLITSELKNN